MLRALQAIGNVRIWKYYPFRVDEAALLRSWLLFQIVFGWVLATLFVAGLTGVVKSN
jgi:hypothetical protein